MNEREQGRERAQRRETDILMEYKEAELQQRNSTMVAIATISTALLGGAWWIATQASMNQLAPVKLLSEGNKIEIQNLKSDILEIKSDQKEALNILRQLAK